MNLGMGPDSSATPTTQCRSKSVSAKSLPKTGISGNLAGDFGRILSKVVAIRSLETEREAQESPYFAGFPRLWCNLSQVDGLAGWRRSADRTRLQANCLLTGNFTGNFAILGLLGPISRQEVPVL